MNDDEYISEEREPLLLEEWSEYENVFDYLSEIDVFTLCEDTAFEVELDEEPVVALVLARFTTSSANEQRGDTLVSIEEYRKLLNDRTSTDERIVERLYYLEAFCRNISKQELQKIYDKRKGEPRN